MSRPTDATVEALERGRYVHTASRHHPPAEISGEPDQVRAPPPTLTRVIELERLITLREASELSSMSTDSLKRHYSHLIRRLSPRRQLDALIEQAPELAREKEPPPEPEPTDIEIEITRLAKLTAVQYEQERKAAAERLNVRASILDGLVRDERTRLGLDNDNGKQGHAISFPEPEAWPQPVDGAALLDRLANAARAHVVMSDHDRDVGALWTVHSYLLDCFFISPRLGVCAPTKGCAKTLLLDVLAPLVLRPLPTTNVTPAAIFRVIEGHRPTLLIDEADTFLRDNDELRGVLNSGHRKGGRVLRTVGEDHEPRAFATYSACAIALIGTLPDTLHDRSVVINLKRRLRSEKIDPFRPDRVAHLDVLARQIARWAKDHAERIANADPAMPDGIINREADNWRPLFAIADQAGGEWPERARAAATAAHSAAGGDATSMLELLLSDIRDIRDEKNVEQIPSGDLVQALVDREGRPWAEMGKSRKPLTQNRLARMLAITGVRIAPKQIRVLHQGGITGQVIEKQVRGYVFADFKDVFDRYLPPKGGLNRHNVTNPANMGTSGNSKVSQPENLVTVAECEKSNNDGLCDGVTDGSGGAGGNASNATTRRSQNVQTQTSIKTTSTAARSSRQCTHSVEANSRGETIQARPAVSANHYRRGSEASGDVNCGRTSRCARRQERC
jgi:putative DNA primase/helicase